MSYENNCGGKPRVADPKLTKDPSKVLDRERCRDEIGTDERTYDELEFNEYTIEMFLYRLETLESVTSYQEKEEIVYKLHGTNQPTEAETGASFC
jgi:hypothetical protein